MPTLPMGESSCTSHDGDDPMGRVFTTTMKTHSRKSPPIHPEMQVPLAIAADRLIAELAGQSHVHDQSCRHCGSRLTDDNLTVSNDGLFCSNFCAYEYERKRGTP